MRIKLAVMFTEVRALNRRNIRHPRTDGSRDKTMIAKCAVGRIDPYPSSAGKENINPGMQTALRSSILDINVELAKESAHHPHGQADLPQDRRAKQRRIPAGARPQFDGPDGNRASPSDRTSYAISLCNVSASSTNASTVFRFPFSRQIVPVSASSSGLMFR